MSTISPQSTSVYNNTSCKGLPVGYNESSARNVLKKFSLALIVVVTILHLTNLILIMVKKKLHKAVYYLLFNLSVGDILLLLVQLVPIQFTGRYIWSYTFIFTSAFYTVSVLSTMGITLERYIRVVYCLSYKSIVTKKYLVLTIIFIWVFSLFLSLVTLSVGKKVIHLYIDYIQIPFRLVCSVILIASSLWIRHIRNTHVNDIKKRKVYFGVADEKLNILQNLSSAVLETIKLNLVTAALIIVGDILRLVHFYYYKECETSMLNAMYGIYCLYFLSNPFVYMTVMTDLRKCYLELLCSRRRNTQVPGVQ